MSTPTLTVSELDQIARDFSAAEDLWLKAQAASATKIECTECGGRGSTGRGSLGDICDACDGTGTLDDDFGDPPIPFPAELGAARAEYKALRAVFDTRELMLRDGAPASQMPALPPASAGAELAAKIEPLRQQARDAVKEYRERQGSTTKALPRGSKPSGGLGAGGSLGGGLSGGDLDDHDLGGEGG